MAGYVPYDCVACGKRRVSSNPDANKGHGTLCPVCDFHDPRHPQAVRHQTTQEQLR